MKERVVNEKGERTRVILDIAEYEKLREAAEEANERTSRHSFPGAGGRPPTGRWAGSGFFENRSSRRSS